MSTLIVYLTPAAQGATPEYPYVLTIDGQSVASQGRASAALLPATKGGEVVAVVDIHALSWQSVDLPKGTARSATPRLRAILEGLLEERLLDETAELHFALAPQANADATWSVAVCERAWLKSALQNLEAADRAATRIVPEIAPIEANSAWQVGGSAEHPWLVRATAQGVSVLPLNAASVTLAKMTAGEDAQPSLLAEPAVAVLAEAAFKRPAQLQQSAQRWLLATQTDWDLAQFDLTSSSGARNVKKLAQAWNSLLHAPQWRALRWGTGLLVAVQLLGLNLWAWQTKSALQAQRLAISSVLTQTFPGVRVVVDAPVQMERELTALRQATGASSRADLEALLATTGASLPAQRSVSGIEFIAGEARLKGLQLKPDEASVLITALQRQGLRARVEADALVVQAEATP